MTVKGIGAATRREFLRDAAVVGTGAAVAATVPTAAWAAARASGKDVAVLGGGMAGLTVAHELVERGFKVTVYEPTALGGKARSIGVPGSATGGRKELPGEHGFRFFPGFYHHVPDTMRRIPFDGQVNGVWDNLVAATGGKFYRAGGRPDAGPFGLFFDPDELLTPDGLQRVLTDALSGQGIPFDEVLYFVSRLLVFLTSSDERRFGQWENTTWWDFIRAENKSAGYKKELAAGLTRSVVAAKETVASTRTIGNMGEAFVFNAMGLGNDGAPDRILDLPTNEAWIDPWVAHLKSLGVKFVSGKRVTKLETAGGKVSSARVMGSSGRKGRITADWFVMAMPAERVPSVLGPGVRRLDPSLRGITRLATDWMVGIQFYLKRKVDLTHGHITFLDAPWALTALTQSQFWADRDFAHDYGDGGAADCLSVDISNWDAKGILFGKTAKQCTPDQVAQEVWAQIKQHRTPGLKLPDSILHSWFLDPGVQWNAATGSNSNETPLLINTAGSWKNRPKAATKVPNLFLSGDYVQTNIDLATMEGANESGRAAVTALLQASGSNATPPKMFKLYRSPDLEGWKQFDAWRYSIGQPNIFDG
jgi:uncharacterized protein with NAD-binding domain and iron-sulfur cluster